MFELNHISLPAILIAAVVLFLCYKFKFMPLGMNVQDPPPGDPPPPPSDDKVSKAEFDEMKRKYDELQKKTDDEAKKKKEEEGQFETLYKELVPKSEAFEKDSKELQDFKAKRKDEIIKELPKDKRETHKKILDNINDLSLIEDYAKEILTKKESRPGTDEGAPGKINLTESSKITDFNSKDLKQIKEENPEGYKKLLSQLTTKK